MPKDAFIQHVQDILDNHKKGKWDSIFPPYLDLSNVELRNGKLIVYKSSRSTQSSSQFNFSGTIEAQITEKNGETILKPSYYLDRGFSSFAKYIAALGVGLSGTTYLLIKPSIGGFLLLILIETLIFVIHEIIKFENSNNLRLYFSRILRELLR